MFNRVIRTRVRGLVGCFLYCGTVGAAFSSVCRYLANLSFFTKGVQMLGLAPAYDILPMMYAPQHAQIIDRPFDPPLPTPADSSIYPRALSAAKDFWKEVQLSWQISAGFKSIAEARFFYRMHGLMRGSWLKAMTPLFRRPSLL